MNKKLLTRTISAASALAFLAGIAPLSAFAAEPRYYPYILYAHSGYEDAVAINSENVCVNGTLAANGGITSNTSFINGEYYSVMDDSLTMVNAHYAILDTYFSDALLFNTDVILNDMNNNISAPIGTDCSFTATGGVNMNASVGAIYDVSFSRGDNATNLNASNAVVYSRLGDVTIECDTLSFCGLIYAPNGTVTIDADNANISGLILAENIIINSNNVNLNYNPHFAELIGSCMDNHPEAIADDTIFEVTKDIIVDTTNLTFLEDSYVIKPEFQELNGQLLMSSMFDSLTVDIYDDHGINVFTQDLAPSLNWQTTNLGLLYGDNYVTITAHEADGEVIQKELLIKCCTPDYNDNLMIDREDPDGDGLINYIENFFETDINNPDTDNDGLTDFQEIYDTSTNPLLWDTDENGICDGNEDSDNDRLDNVTEYIAGSLVYAADSDLDGLYDYDEYMTYLTSPSLADTDGDTLTDAEELDFGTDPLLPDTDNDGVSDADQIYTRTLNIQDMDTAYDPSVYPLLEFTSDARNIASVTMETYDSDSFLNPLMTGYIGDAYTFSSDHAFDSAVMTFTIDESWFEDPDFMPVIFYFNEETRMLEEVSNQTIEGNTVSAPVEHFSTYIVLNGKSIQEVWSHEIDYIPNNNLEIVFVLDNSTSIERNDPNDYRISVAQEFVDKLGSNDKAGVVVFNYYTYTQALTNDFNAVKNQIEIARTTEYNTELWHGLEEGYNLFEDEKAPNTKRYVIFMSDGVANNNLYYSTTAEQCQQLKIDKSIDKVFVIGLGKYYCNDTLLRGIADTDCYYELSEYSNEADFFRNTYGSISSTVNASSSSSDGSETDEEYSPYIDSNDDGISDYYTALMCKGELQSGTFGYVFGYPIYGWEALYDEVQSNADYDGDGVINGKEITIEEDCEGHTNVVFTSDPTKCNSDGDNYDDRVEYDGYGTNPMVKEIVFSDIDTDYLLDNYYMSDVYYNQYKGWTLQSTAAFIGNFAYGSKVYYKEVCFETLYDYLVECNTELRNAAELNEHRIFLNSLSEICDYSINTVWTAYSDGLLSDAKLREVFNDYCYCKDEIESLEIMIADAPECDLTRLLKRMERVQAGVEEANIGGAAKKTIKLTKNVNKFFKNTSRGISVATMISEGMEFYHKYNELATDLDITQQSIEILNIISEHTTDFTIRDVSHDMSLAIDEAIKPSTMFIDLFAYGLTSGSTFWIGEAIGVLAKILPYTEIINGVGTGIAIGTVVGKTISPVTIRSEYAQRVYYMANIAQTLARWAAIATRPAEDPHVKYHKVTGYQIGIWKSDEAGKEMQLTYICAFTSRYYAEEQLITMLSDTNGNWAQNNMSQSINCVFAAICSLFMKNSSTKASEIIEESQIVQSIMLLRVKQYSVL